MSRRIAFLSRAGSTAAALAVAVLAIAPGIAPASAGDPAAADRVLSVPVSFPVENVNRSALSCASDGLPYTLEGRLVGPRRALLQHGGSIPVTLYVHELNMAKFFWSLQGTPEYDYAAQMAERGHVSVLIDRLGYGESPHPDGNDVCIGSQADIVHQVIAELRSGAYSADRIAARAFDRVVLAGHSVGGQISELESYSFADADALLLFAWADQSYTPEAISETFEQGVTCGSGGEPWAPGGAGGYAYITQDDEEFRQLYFHSAPESLIAQVTALRQRDPCGDVNSGTPGIVLDNSRVDEIEVPVLLLYGLADAVFSQPTAGQRQAALFTGSDDVTTHFYEETAHALAFEQGIGQIRADVDAWLAARDFRYAAPAGCDAYARTFVGSEAADLLRGSESREGLLGDAGDDELHGRGRGDCLAGGPGADRLAGGPGDDTIDARDGERDLVSCGRGLDRVDADPADRLLRCERSG